MSEESKGDNVTPENVDHVDDQESSNQTSDAGKNTVKYETYSRVLSKLKKTEAEHQSLNERLAQLEQEKLEAEGNKDKLIESLRNERETYKTKMNEFVGTYAVKQAKSALREEALKSGCNAVDLLEDALERKLSDLEFDDDGFTPNRDQVKMLVEEYRAKAPTLFSKEAPKVANHNLAPQDLKKGKKDILKMKDDELDELWKKTFQR